MLQQKLHGTLAFQRDLLADRRQAGSQVLRDLHIIEADNGIVVRDAFPCFKKSFDRADGQNVGSGHNAGYSEPFRQ